ncbi:hypothetical protein OHA71_06665 [Streptomyces sp. NBC_00444]|uniref:hypothetical protein n=1 Tax=Streptomyces sp. NBC_00444 TaxID=2975744 RepID=UPI002E1EBD3D
MIPEITIGASALMASLIAAALLLRWAVAPPRHGGRHRAPEFIEVPLDHLMPAWTEAARPALATQDFRVCRPCGGEVSVVVHGDAHRCEHGHVTITGGYQ